MSLGFTFNNVHSRDIGVVFKSVDRTLLPIKRVTRYVIPGKSGTYDIEDGYAAKISRYCFSTVCTRKYELNLLMCPRHDVRDVFTSSRPMRPESTHRRKIFSLSLMCFTL